MCVQIAPVMPAGNAGVIVLFIDSFPPYLRFCPVPIRRHFMICMLVACSAPFTRSRCIQKRIKRDCALMPALRKVPHWCLAVKILAFQEFTIFLFEAFSNVVILISNRSAAFCTDSASPLIVEMTVICHIFVAAQSNVAHRRSGLFYMLCQYLSARFHKNTSHCLIGQAFFSGVIADSASSAKISLPLFKVVQGTAVLMTAYCDIAHFCAVIFVFCFQKRTAARRKQFLRSFKCPSCCHNDPSKAITDYSE